MSTYAWVDLCSVLVPFLFSFHPRLRFHERFAAVFPAIGGMMLLFVPWDALFTRAGVWGFDPRHVHAMRLLDLPLEEWAFFLCIPYACVFSYHCFAVLGLKDIGLRGTRRVVVPLAAVLITAALLNTHRAYTFTAFLLCGTWLLFAAFVQRGRWLGRFLISYVILLLPFLVVNGILTGTGLESPVVWYANTGILGVRIGTIPLEDVLYGLLMVGLTVSMYESMRARSLDLAGTPSLDERQ